MTRLLSTMKRWVTVALLITPILLGLSANAATILKTGDRVVFYGDSITEQRLYTRYIQQYVYCRYPELKVHFYNAGWSGDTAGGALNRLERDVLVLKPTIVTLFFGMNDGGYTTLRDDIVANYTKNLDGIITALQAKGVRVIVYTPGCVDYDRREPLRAANYNDTLAALGKAAITLAQKYNCSYVDVHHGMLTYQAAQKAKSASYTMIPDSVHPDPNGHLVMANEMLKAFAVEPMPQLGTVNVLTKQVTGSAKLISGGADNATIELTPSTTPFWVDSGSTATVAQCGLGDLVAQKLTVKGLTAGTYQVNAGKLTASTTADALAAGYALPGTFSPAAQSIHDLTRMKEDLYFTAWRQVRLGLGDRAGASDVVAGLLAADDGFSTILNSASPADSKVTITISPRPDGANLALDKQYVCSDPNGYGWGLGKLTDGSYEGNGGHCFASGDKDEFPKTVTIDLEQPAKVGSVIVGVPNFGSTKTITVAVSADGKTFTDVGTHVFPEATETKFTYIFPGTTAKFVRLTYPDHYDAEHGYSKNFAFTTEAEVYASK
ncbi:MAG TPA: GDSL-type esterase/lipase family protein [Capsulimonadaceae bacterium]